MPRRKANPLGQTYRHTMSLDAATVAVIDHVARRDYLSFSEATSQLILAYALQVPDLHQVIRQKVVDVVQAELVINGMGEDSHQVVLERLLGREE